MDDCIVDWVLIDLVSVSRMYSTELPYPFIRGKAVIVLDSGDEGLPVATLIGINIDYESAADNPDDLKCARVKRAIWITSTTGTHVLQ